MYVLLGQSPVIQKEGLIGQPLSYLRLPQEGGGVSVHSPEIGVTLVRLL